MIPHLVSYSHTVVDGNGNKHEIGLHGYVEEGETYQQAVSKVSALVQEQSQQFVVNYDDLINEVEREINELDEQINGRLDSLQSYTQFAEANGLDFKPPTPFEPIERSEIYNDSEGTAAGETTESTVETQ